MFLQFNHFEMEKCTGLFIQHIFTDIWNTIDISNAPNYNQV